MKEENVSPKECESKKFCTRGKSGGASGAVYGLGLLGAAYYFIQHAHTFTDGLIGVLKAFVWPALLIYKVFVFFKF